MPGIIDQLELPEEEPKASGSIIDQLELPDEQLAPTATGGSIIDQLDLPETQETPIQRKPADDDGQRHGWNFMDTVIAGAPAVADAWQNMVPGLNQAIITDYEAAPNANRGGWWGKAVDTVSDIGSSVVSGAAGAALGGPIGMGITGAADQLGRNFEDKIIEGARERMAANPELTKQEAADQAFRAGEGKLDAGDYAESALSGVFAYGGGKVGEKAFRKVAESGFPTVRRLVQGSAAPVAYDAVTGGLQGAASVLNRENVDSVSGAADALTDPNNLKQIATGAAIGAGMSVGGQTAQGIGFYKRGNSPGISPAREAELQTDLQGEVDALRMEGQARAEARAQREQAAANAAERQRIADVETRAAQTRDLVEAERAETNRVQEEQSIREARRNIEAARQQALREAQEAEAAFRENPTMENAEARVAAIDRVNELAQTPTDLETPAQPQPELLALPAPKGMTTGEFPGIMRQADTDSFIDPDWTPATDGAEMLGYVPKVNPTKGGGSSELPTREGQGQTPGRPFGLSPLRRQSQAIEATQPTAGEGVINQRGEQIELPGEPVKRGMGMNALRRGSLERGQQDSPEVKAIKAAITTSKDARHINVPKKSDLWRTEVFDKFRPIQRLSQAAEKATGDKMKAIDDPYKVFRGLNRKIISTVNKAMTKGLPKFGGNEPASPSMQQILRPIQGNTEDFDALLAARRAPEMANRQESLPFTPETAEVATQQLAQKPGMEQALEDYDQFIGAGLQYVLDSGLKTQAEIDQIRKTNQLYAPWERVDEDGNIRLGTSPAPGRRPDQTGDPLKRVTKEGSTKNIHSPLEVSMKNTVQLVAAAEKNAAKRKMVDVAMKSPELEAFAMPVDEATAKTLSPSKVITVKREGKTEFYQVDPEIKKTLEGLTPEEADLTDRMMTGIANAFRGSVTLHPPFAVNNLFRDGFQQSIISRSAKLPLPFQNQFRGLGLLATKRGRDTWKEWRESAANQAIEYGAVMNRGQLLNDMAVQAKKTPNVIFDKRNINPANWPSMVLWAERKGVHGLNKVMQTSEAFGRVGEYDRVKKQSLKKGFTEAEARAEAEFESADLGDFSMGGRNRKIQTARRWIPFLGSAASFGYREAGALKNPKTWLKGIAVLGGLESLNFYVNQDDPDYWNLPDDQRRRYWHWPLGNGNFVAIPKPIGEIGYIFTEPFRNLFDSYIAGSTDPNAVDFVSNFFESVMPPEAPAFIRTAVELNAGDAGYSYFYERPIVDRGLLRLPKEMQYSDRTSLAARHLGSGLRKLGIGASPQKIDYAISSGMGSGARSVVENVIDPAISAVTGERVPGEPFVKSMTRRNYFYPEDKGSEAIDEFYEKLDRAEKAAAADKAGEQHEYYSKHELRQMRRKADKLAELRRDLQKYVGNEEKRREIKRKMVYEIRKQVKEEMPAAFGSYQKKPR